MHCKGYAVKKGLVLIAVLLCLIPVSAQESAPSQDSSFELFLGGSASFDGSLSTRETVAFDLSAFDPNAPLFSAFADFSINNDGKYSAAHANLPGGRLGDLYFMIDQGGVEYSSGGIALTAGVLRQKDAIDSPYSLFANGSGLPAASAELTFTRNRFSYTSRWIGLNTHSSNLTTAFPAGFPDRGANLKIYSIAVGDMVFGIEDAAVYSGRYFDFAYFADPMPNYFIQYVTGTEGRPWATGYEDNDLVGAFWTWNSPEGFELYAQALVDDFNVYPFIPNTPRNPWKAAWTLGGDVETRFGTFGFHHAGATKYAFEPTYELPGREYGYTYYPDTVYIRDGAEDAIPFEDMMIGYLHGENNLAFMGTWSHEIAGFGLASSLEFTLSGSKSPANAWHEPTWTTYEGTRLLDEAVLEKKILARTRADKSFGRFSLFADISLGYVFNEIKLAAITPEQVTIGSRTWAATSYSGISIWKPSSTDRFLYSVSLGGVYRFAW